MGGLTKTSWKPGQSGNPAGMSKEEVALRRQLRLKLLKRLDRTLSRPDSEILKVEANGQQVEVVVQAKDSDATEAGKLLAKILGMEAPAQSEATVTLQLSAEERESRLRALLGAAAQRALPEPAADVEEDPE